VLEEQVHGVLITPVVGVSTPLASLQKRGTPVVLVDRRSPSRGQRSVADDDLTLIETDALNVFAGQRAGVSIAAMRHPPPPPGDLRAGTSGPPVRRAESWQLRRR
jgi:DNA-binding LacI/PurR family transcriptional regulator